MERSEMSAAQESGAGDGPFFELRVERVIEETHDSRSVVLGVPEALKETFAYRAGQFLSFGVHIGDHHLVRCYSLASSPDCESEHKVTIKRVEDGRVSNWFHDQLVRGDALHVMKPAGHFCLQERNTSLVMFGGGSGITPVISLVKSALATTKRAIVLVYANRDDRSIIFRDELDALATAHSERFTLIHRLDDVDGFLGVEDARAHARADPGADFYICGPGPYMDVVEQALDAESIASDQIFIERFISPELAALDAPPPADLGAASAIVQVYLDGEIKAVPVHEGETILAAAHRAGLDAPCACLEGYCGSCMALVKEGRVEMKLNDGGLGPEQVQQGWVLTCQSVAMSPSARLDYPDPD
jgi:3-ketosteroid 9alpha-monooxygenase subunit B